MRVYNTQHASGRRYGVGPAGAGVGAELVVAGLVGVVGAGVVTVVVLVGAATVVVGVVIVVWLVTVGVVPVGVTVV